MVNHFIMKIKKGTLSTLRLTEDVISVQDSSKYVYKIAAAQLAWYGFRTEFVVDKNGDVAETYYRDIAEGIKHQVEIFGKTQHFMLTAGGFPGFFQSVPKGSIQLHLMRARTGSLHAPRFQEYVENSTAEGAILYCSTSTALL